MDAGADRTRPEIDIASLEVRKRYRVDWKNEELRRSFRFTGTLLSIDVAPAAAPGSAPGEEPARWLAFEVKPRFGKATFQRIDVATIKTIEPL